jgi:hypothetical protein
MKEELRKAGPAAVAAERLKKAKYDPDRKKRIGEVAGCTRDCLSEGTRCHEDQEK